MNSKDPINSRVLANFVSVHLPWQGNALPLSHSRIFYIFKFHQMVRMKRLELPRRKHQILSLARLPIPPHPLSFFRVVTHPRIELGTP